MSAHLPRVAFWLVPEAAQRKELQECIRTLAKQFMAPIFVPHVTVYSCQQSPDRQELALVEELAAKAWCFSAEVECLSGDDALTRTLYLQLARNNIIEHLYQALHSKVPMPSQFNLRPHLSLLYKNIDEQQRERLYRDVGLVIDRIHFAELWAVAIPQQLKTEADLTGWQPLLRRPLAAGEITGTI